MSDGTIRVALRTLGYEKEEITPHGFRAMASTVLNEHGFEPDIIERQLAHVQGNQVRAAYNHAQYLDQRRKMMQWWGDWLDELM
jgi:integrase